MVPSHFKKNTLVIVDDIDFFFVRFIRYHWYCLGYIWVSYLWANPDPVLLHWMCQNLPQGSWLQAKENKSHGVLWLLGEVQV